MEKQLGFSLRRDAVIPKNGAGSVRLQRLFQCMGGCGWFLIQMLFSAHPGNPQLVTISSPAGTNSRVLLGRVYCSRANAPFPFLVGLCHCLTTYNYGLAA